MAVGFNWCWIGWHARRSGPRALNDSREALRQKQISLEAAVSKSKASKAQNSALKKTGSSKSCVQKRANAEVVTPWARILNRSLKPIEHAYQSETAETFTGNNAVNKHKPLNAQRNHLRSSKNRLTEPQLRTSLKSQPNQKRHSLESSAQPALGLDVGQFWFLFVQGVRRGPKADPRSWQERFGMDEPSVRTRSAGTLVSR